MNRIWSLKMQRCARWGMLSLSILPFAACNSKSENDRPAEPTASVEATDENIREDIREYIQGEFAADSDELRAATQYAASKQAELDVIDQKAAVLTAVRASFRSQSCVNYVLGIERAGELAMELRARLLNNAERTEAYLAMERHLGGEMFMLPPAKNLAGTCDFALQRNYDE